METEAKKGFVNLKYGKISYSIYGKREEGKKLVVCVHGIGAYNYCWDSLAKALSSDFIVLTFGKYQSFVFNLKPSRFVWKRSK